MKHTQMYMQLTVNNLRLSLSYETGIAKWLVQTDFGNGAVLSNTYDERDDARDAFFVVSDTLMAQA
jgi:hypothetical protein